ncbi:hypothetical protein O9G_002289 [Rozella allomycis CSF55]|uniref:Pinin/SDK/MemA protein domain-containing protein n=1 Tax=Rozella allomycis (strain CSF55) TaxID=988480 RepID=A0A075AQL3_ROZAC|nr:hypothetical protein O9G_002289 [Rozella allomycis CSF55]|eukprot:EPZ32513.1 hypothetical protein O9G_002289 [Rozella allomycis CSF55]
MVLPSVIENAPKRLGNAESESLTKRIKNDPIDIKRNKRMMGVMLGTLSKFKQDLNQTIGVDNKRKEIDLKLKEKLAQEKEQTRIIMEKERKERRSRILDARKSETLQLEQTITADLEKRYDNYSNFLSTNAMPSLFFRPAELLPDQIFDQTAIKEKCNQIKEKLDTLESQVERLEGETIQNDEPKKQENEQ